MSPTSSMAKRQSGSIVETVKTLVYAVLIALLIRTVAFEPFNIPSGSMIPTLLIGDYVFVSKYSYGYSRYSLPFLPPPISGRLFGAVPARGDIAVFRYPRDTSIDYIKRIIGLPGDHIQMREGRLYINGAQLPRQLDGRYVAYNEFGQATEWNKFVETLPNGLNHPILKGSDSEQLDNTDDVVVPPDAVFAMGDNRDNSSDSRVFGFVPLDNLVGRAEFIFFSFDFPALSHWYDVWEWPLDIRWSRLLQGVR